MIRSSSFGTSGTSSLGGLGLLLQQGGEHLGARAAAERPSAGHHLVEHRSEGEDIAARVDRAARGLLRRHVRGRAGDRSRAAEPRLRVERRDVLAAALVGLRQLGQAEVQDLGDTLRRDHHVRGLEVAVDDAGGVGGGERVGQGNGDPQRLAEAHPLRGG